MSTIVFHVDHRLAPCDSPDAAVAIGEILVRPCFGSLSRVAINTRDRDVNHQGKTAAHVTACLLENTSDAAVLDNGRSGELVAMARIWTGRHIKKYDEPKPFLSSYIVLPYANSQREDLLVGFVDLIRELEATAGFVSCEPDYDRAHRAALNKPWRLQDHPGYPRQRAQERKGHFWYGKKIDTEIAGPDWGIVLGPGHLQRLPPIGEPFAVVRDAGAAKLVQLTADPADALAHEFPQKLEEARRLLAPILMDVSHVPVDYTVE